MLVSRSLSSRATLLTAVVLAFCGCSDDEAPRGTGEPASRGGTAGADVQGGTAGVVGRSGASGTAGGDASSGTGGVNGTAGDDAGGDSADDTDAPVDASPDGGAGPFAGCRWQELTVPSASIQLDIGVAPNGTLYLAGSQLHESTTGGNSWTVSDPFWPERVGWNAVKLAFTGAGTVLVHGQTLPQESPPEVTVVIRRRVAGGTWQGADTVGPLVGASNPVAAGVAVLAGTPEVLLSASALAERLIRKSTNDGASWQTVSTHEVFPAEGELRAVGSFAYWATTDWSSSERWVTRRSTDGTSWEEVDGPVGSWLGFPRAIVGNGDAVYVAGLCTDAYWTVRRSRTGAPGTWTTVDRFHSCAAGSDGGYPCADTVSDAVLDSRGRVHVVGAAGVPNNWHVRSSSDGTTWLDTDHFPGWFAQAAAADAAGRVYVLGGTMSSNTYRLRRFDCP